MNNIDPKIVEYISQAYTDKLTQVTQEMIMWKVEAMKLSEELKELRKEKDDV